MPGSGELWKAFCLGTLLHSRQLAFLFPLLAVLQGPSAWKQEPCSFGVHHFYNSCCLLPSPPTWNEGLLQQATSRSTGEGSELSEVSCASQNWEEAVRIQEGMQNFSRSVVPAWKQQNRQVHLHNLMEKISFMTCEIQRCHLWIKKSLTDHLWRLWDCAGERYACPLVTLFPSYLVLPTLRDRIFGKVVIFNKNAFPRTPANKEIKEKA